jgi:hypothetical protein
MSPTPAPRRFPLNLRGLALGVGLGAALSASNGPAVGLAVGAAGAIVFSLLRGGCSNRSCP